MSEQKLTRRQQAEMYLKDPNVRRYLDLLSYTEGTQKNGYYTKFGGGKIDNLSWHPNINWGKTGDGPTSATGRYQILKGTWAEQAKLLGLKDFSPESQDLAAVSLMMRRGAINDILNGDIDSANRKLSKEWASLPYNNSPHQHQKSKEEVLQEWERLGGKDYPVPALQFDGSTTPVKPIANVPQPQPLSPTQWLDPFSPESQSQPQQPQRKPIDPFASFTDSFNQINGTLDAFAPQEPEINYREKYKKELANAFGVEPPTENKLPNEIENLVRSIYDQT